MGKKLIEVSLPLDEINKASVKEKEPFTRNHPRSIHIWWARRPLAAARAVLFSSIVDDPSSEEYRWPDGLTIARTEDAIEKERKRLHDLIVELVQWENSNNEEVLGRARAEIMRATDGNPPPVLDPFAGGGSIPLEAQRLGLEAHASDLNPVAVLINKALIEIPPKFAGMPPVNPVDRAKGMGAQWKGAAGLAADVRYYGQWMRDEAEKRIGHLYPKATLPDGSEATVIAWLWARTVTCPNPACGAQMPLARSFVLSKKAGRTASAVPEVKSDKTGVTFRIGQPQRGEIDGTVDGKSARCLVCGELAPLEYVRSEGQAHRMSAQLMAVVAEGRRGREYVAPSEKHSIAAQVSAPDNVPETDLPERALGFRVQAYGMTRHRDLFTDRQLVALTTFSDLVGEAREKVLADARSTNMTLSDPTLDAPTEYSKAIATYLSMCVSRWSDLENTIASWNSTNQNIRALFARQAIPMSWDFVELSPFGNLGSLSAFSDSTANLLQHNVCSDPKLGYVSMRDAARDEENGTCCIVSTDPPYYDNIGYADLSDFFYVWLRRMLSNLYPELFETLLVPKHEELVASPYRFGGSRKEAEEFFELGLKLAFRKAREKQCPDFPQTVYYAYKQSEDSSLDESRSTASTGWEKMLEGLIVSGFLVSATWPIRTERATRSIGIGTNALASSIVLACRIRPSDAPTISRNEFQRRLRRELPAALKTMQQASIAPVDLAQAAIGPGMKIYSEFSGVLEPNGEKMRVRTALQLINQVLDETLSEQDSDYDRDTGWAVAWFSEYGMNEAEYGRAETLATARGVSVTGLGEAGIVKSSRGKAQLIARADLKDDWNPERDKRPTDWEATQYLIRALEAGGQEAAARLKRQLGGRADIAKELAYRLYGICERKGWSSEGQSYNGLVMSWPEIERHERELPATVTQTRFE